MWSAISLPSSVPSVAPVSDNMEHGLHYAFYDHSDKKSDGPKMYAELLRSAQNSIRIWDPYFNKSGASDHLLFGYIKNPVEIYYLTNGTKVENCRIAREKAQLLWDNVPVAVRDKSTLHFAFVTKDVNDDYMFHDRWLILDDSRYFLVGGSINYHAGTPTCSTGIYEVMDDEDQQLISKKFNKFYQHAIDDSACIIKP